MSVTVVNNISRRIWSPGNPPDDGPLYRSRSRRTSRPPWTRARGLTLVPAVSTLRESDSRPTARRSGV